MNVRIESMSHGDGKVYLQLVLDRLSPQAEVLLDAHLKMALRSRRIFSLLCPSILLRRQIMWLFFRILMCEKLILPLLNFLVQVNRSGKASYG